MNLIDIAAIALIIGVVLLSLHKGAVHTILSAGAILVSCILALIFMPIMANSIEANEGLYGSMLSYTEGSEFIENAELARVNVSTLSSEEINTLIEESNVPTPIGKCIRENIAKEAFAKDNIYTLGDYFNQTMVTVFVNILSFLLLFIIFILACTLVINWYDHVFKLPHMKNYDRLFAVAGSLIRGMLLLFVIFMLIPIVLSMLGTLDMVQDMISGSLLSKLFYQSNFLLFWIPGA